MEMTMKLCNERVNREIIKKKMAIKLYVELCICLCSLLSGCHHYGDSSLICPVGWICWICQLHFGRRDKTSLILIRSLVGYGWWPVMFKDNLLLAVNSLTKWSCDMQHYIFGLEEAQSDHLAGHVKALYLYECPDFIFQIALVTNKHWTLFIVKELKSCSWGSITLRKTWLCVLCANKWLILNRILLNSNTWALTTNYSLINHIYDKIWH